MRKYIMGTRDSLGVPIEPDEEIPWQEDELPQEEPEEEMDEEPEYVPYRQAFRAPVREEEPVVTGIENAGGTPLSRSLAAAQAAADRGKPKTQNVLAAQEAAKSVSFTRCSAVI